MLFRFPDFFCHSINVCGISINLSVGSESVDQFYNHKIPNPSTKMTMTQQQINVVRKTWSVFQKIDPVLIGEVFYEKLFTEHPFLRRLFTNSTQSQARKLIGMLDVIISRIDSLEDLNKDLQSLAVRHAHYGVKSEYYQPVGIALLWMLRQGLGEGWDDEVAAAWQACYDIIAGVMIKAGCSA